MNLVFSLDNYLSTYYVPGFVAGTGNAIMDMRDSLCSCEDYILMEGDDK